MTKILIIDDEKSIRHTLREILEYEKYTVEEAENGKEGLEKLAVENYGLVLCDIKMPEVDGIEVLSQASTMEHVPPFIMVSAHATIDTAVEATKKGAYDFIQKPPDLNRLLITVKNALDKSNLMEETKVLRRKISKTKEIVGESEGVHRMKEVIDKVANTEARVLITGENGTGKELVAHAIHHLSARCKKPLVEVNCAAIPSELIESELFGHEKGSFTSAIKQRVGKFEQANNGTLFLDEIGDMNLAAQAKVLRVLQENKITRVGGEKEIKVNVRVLAATNKDLKREIFDKRFREDLYHRLSVIVIKVPPLRERINDIPLLVDRFLDNIAKEYGSTKKEIEPEAIEHLRTGQWTGNIRELRNVIERLVIMSGGAVKLSDAERYADIQPI